MRRRQVIVVEDADRVTERVVHVLEAIQIDEEERVILVHQRCVLARDTLIFNEEIGNADLPTEHEGLLRNQTVRFEHGGTMAHLERNQAALR
jgi:hypothetical protein